MIATERVWITLEEFRALPETNTPIELIDGELIVSPSPIDLHQDATGNTYIVVKKVGTKGKAKISPLDVYLGDNVVQPDVFWVSNEGSQCKLGDDGFWYGAPDLVVEVLSPGSANRDHRRKYQLYEQFGSREYWIIDPQTEAVYVFFRKTRQDERFEALGIFKRGQSFESPLLAANIDVNDLLP
jgi:Uma2 family endonuclease